MTNQRENNRIRQKVLNDAIEYSYTPEFLASLDPEHRRAVIQNTNDEAPVVAELNSAGYPGRDIAEIRRKFRLPISSIRPAISILCKWYPLMMHNRYIRAAIVSAMMIRQLGDETVKKLLGWLKTEPNELVESRLGQAIACAASPRLYPQLVEVARDKRLVNGRRAIVWTLYKYKHETTFALLVELINDPVVVVAAVHSLGRLRDPRARPHLEAKLKDANPDARKEAAKWLKRMDEREKKSSS